MADNYLVLARKWRPQTFDDVVGQQHVTRTLQNAIRAGRISHAFLLIGSRGIGKTTTARILSRALNCTGADGPTPTPCGKCDNCVTIASGNNIDVIEIDGASNNSVEDVRQIREHVRMTPAQSRFKIYIIDEVHQLSSGAFNALLKTLEEPPAHAVFILATTEAHKIPATIVSRCQRYDFRRVGLEDIVALLRKIVDAEGVKCSDDALFAIARAADGAVRDAESILDQLVSYCDGEITYQDVYDVLGLVDWNVLHGLCGAVRAKDIAQLLQIVDEIVASGKDLGQFVQEILRYFRNLLVCKTGGPKELLAVPEDQVAVLQENAGHFTLTDLIRLVEQLAELGESFESQLAQRTALEAFLIRISKQTVEVSVDSVLEKLLRLAGPNPDATGAGGGRTEAVRAIQGGSPTAVESSALVGRKGVAPSAADASDRAERRTPATITAATGNVKAVWTRVLRALEGRASMNLRVWLGHVEPARVEGDALVVRLEHGQDTSRNMLEKAENRAVIESALRETTSNIRRLRLEQAPAPSIPALPAAGALPVAGRVNPRTAETVLRDPRVAKVVDVFKGRIVDVKPPDGPSASPPRPSL